MLKIVIPKEDYKIKQQIQSLEWQINRDTNDKDKQIHIAALNVLKANI